MCSISNMVTPRRFKEEILEVSEGGDDTVPSPFNSSVISVLRIQET